MKYYELAELVARRERLREIREDAAHQVKVYATKTREHICGRYIVDGAGRDIEIIDKKLTSAGIEL